MFDTKTAINISEVNAIIMPIKQKKKQYYKNGNMKILYCITCNIQRYPSDKTYNLYDMLDTTNQLPRFTPDCQTDIIRLLFISAQTSITKKKISFHFFMNFCQKFMPIDRLKAFVGMLLTQLITPLRKTRIN